MSELTIEVDRREDKGKNVSRRLRAAGQIPAVVYGEGKDPVKIAIGQRKVEDLLRKGGGENAVFFLKLAGTKQSRHTMIKDLQRDPMTGGMIHIDFQRVNLKNKVKVSVPVELIGESVGVKTDGGLLDFVTREVEVECLPDAIPPHLEAEVSELHAGQHLEAGELSLPDGLELLTDPNRVIVAISKARAEEEEVEGEEGEGLATSTQAEPEVIGQKDGEEGA